MTRRSVRYRIAATAIFLAMIFALLMGRAVQLTVIDGSELGKLANRQHLQRVKMPPRRGAIVDRYGKPLALTRESVAVYMRPKDLEAGPGTLAIVARLLDMSGDVVAAKAASDSSFVWLDRQVKLDRWAAVQELGIPGIGGQPTRQRIYPQGSLAGHLMGFIGIDGQGLEGIEKMLDAGLRGEADALDVERDARGRRMAVDGRWRPLPRVGAQLELTIDSALQRVAEAELQDAVMQFRADAGTAIVMDPHTGEVLAMANVPEFDPNGFARASPEQWRNRAVTDSYEPGSTFKAILAAAALEEEVVKPGDQVFCERGRYRIGRRVIHDHHPEKTLTFAEVIEKSSNIGSAKVAEMLGRERFADAIDRFGFGRQTGIDLPGETAGLVRPVRRWGDIHTATIAFGQGIAATPLQMVRAFAALANGGFLMRPYVVRRIVTENGRETHIGRPQVQGRAISAQTAALVTDILRGVVDRGTGQSARIEGISLAGKTGTSQKVDPETGGYSKSARMSSFIAYGPARDPRLVTLVVIDTPRKATYGSIVAAPAVRRIMEFGLEQRGIRPWVAPVPVGDPGPALLHRVAASVPEEPLIAPGGVPEFLGLSMRDAVVEARRAGFTVNLSGSGYVVDQKPAPGEDPIASEVVLEFGPQARL